MDLSVAFGNINWLSVIVSAIAAFAIGSIWYTPVLFGNRWLKEVNLDEGKKNSANMPMIFGLAFVSQFIAAVVLDMFLGVNATASFGLIAGLLVGVAWVATSLATNYLFSQKSLALFLIDAGYFIVLFAVMGLILGAW